MKKITLILFSIFCLQIGYSQCPAGSLGQFPTSTISAVSDDAVVGISGCNYTGEYSVVDNITTGSDYEVSISNGAYATIVDANNITNVIAHGISPVSFTAPVGVTSININWTNDANCGETSSCFTTSIQCTSCAPLPSPNCAEAPISPTDGATDVVVGIPVTVTWTAASSGPTPTSYDFYAGIESDGSDLSFVGNVATATIDVNFNFYSTTYYWQVIPKNGGSEATGCSLNSFTTEDFVGSTPATIQTITVNSCGDTQTATNLYDSSVDSIQWIELLYSGGCEDLVIDTDSTTGFTDTELGIYDSNGNLLGSDDDGGAGLLSLLTLDGLEPGTYYIAAGAWNVTYSPGFNASSSSTTASGSMVIDFVSGLTLSNDEFNSTQFTYYPNPTKDKLYFNSVETIDEIAVFNLLGQQVLSQNPHALNPEINLSDLNSGNYFVRVKIKNRIETIKIIKD